MRKKIDYWSYLFKYNIRLKYLNWNYISKNKIAILFMLLNLFLFIISSIEGIKSLNFPTKELENPLNAFSNWLLSFNTGVIVITFLNLASKARPFYLNYRKAKLIIERGEIYSDDEKYEGIEPQKGYKNLLHTYKKLTPGSAQAGEYKDTVFYSPELNDYLIKSKGIELVLSKKGSKIQKFIFDHFDQLKLFLKIRYYGSKTSTLINENKLCLSEDIEINRPVEYHKGTYFDTILTNDIAGSEIRDKVHHKTVVDQQIEPLIEICTGFPDCFMRISDNLLNNNIGASTIGFTSDNQLIFWIQSGAAQHSQGLIAPTGSGSCDYEDITDNDLLQTIKKTMERELLEESTEKVNFDNIVETRIIGYFRWQNRGGLPQFVGITRLNLRKNELEANISEIREPNAEEKGNLSRAFSDSDSSTDDILAYLKTRLKLPNLSVPLFYNLVALIDYIEKYPDKAKDFFFPSN